MLLGMNVGYENEKKEEFKMINSEDSCSYMGVGGRRKPKCLNQTKYSLHTVSGNIILSTFIFVISLINIESGRKLRRGAGLEDKNERRLYIYI